MQPTCCDGADSGQLERLIDVWPALPLSAQQAVCALAELGNPETNSEERTRLGAELNELIRSLGL